MLYIRILGSIAAYKRSAIKLLNKKIPEKTTVSPVTKGKSLFELLNHKEIEKLSVKLKLGEISA